MAERNYEFRRRLSEIHKPDRRNPGSRSEAIETEITDEWKIVIDRQAGALVYHVARDFEDYLLVSMGVSVKLARVDDLSVYIGSNTPCIVLATGLQLPDTDADLGITRSYRLIIKEDCVIINGFDDRGTAQGSYYLEDMMNTREGPFLKKTDIVRKPVFQPRMVHSGWGIEEYPDAHLNAIAHAGMDAIMLFVNGVDTIPGPYNGELLPEYQGSSIYKDFNDLVSRASSYGIDVYMYSYLESNMHPDDPGAEKYYEDTYGKIFRECPGFKGVVLVGESCEFPSKDSHTTLVMRKDLAKLEFKSCKPTPGWWPCFDYPQWLNMIKKVVRKYNPAADIVFWTYNWGWAPEDARLELIRNLPEDITLQATFEMFEEYERNGVKARCVDYTLAFEGPSRYFASEAKAARERGLKLYTMSNTAGLTWDIGVIPYEPAPYQWTKRHEALKKAQADWGLAGLMESHHFGWWPSFISELSKASYWSPSPKPEEVCRNLARRDFSEEAVPYVLEAWKCWSEAIRYYIPTNEDQYGPFRVGPSYPLNLKSISNVPSLPYARFGNAICIPKYDPPDETCAFDGIQVEKQMDSLDKMDSKMREGIDQLKKAIDLTEERKKNTGVEMIRLGEFIHHCIVTTINVKKWWMLKSEIYHTKDIQETDRILTEMVALAESEIRNAEAAIPLVDDDSRLGWEPSMEYICDSGCIKWKIRQVRNVIDQEIPELRKNFNESCRY